MSMRDIFLRLPFSGDFPVSLAFGSTPLDPMISERFRRWGVIGHHGIDFALPEGTPVVACAAGVVTRVGEYGDWGLSVSIAHSWGESIYAHLSQISVTEGQEVVEGASIGASGHTGEATGPHLHFGIRPNDANLANGYLGFIDPSSFFRGAAVVPGFIPLTELQVRANAERKRKRDERRQKILELARAAPITSGLIQKHFHISRQLATIDLSFFVSQGLLTRIGHGPSTSYIASSNGN